MSAETLLVASVVFLAMAIFSLSTGMGIVGATSRYILYLKQRDEKRKSGKKYRVVAYHEPSGEKYTGLVIFHDEPKVGEKLCRFGYLEKDDLDDPMSEFLYPVGEVTSVMRTIGEGDEGEEAVVMIRFDQLKQIDMLSKTVAGWESARLIS